MEQRQPNELNESRPEPENEVKPTDRSADKPVESQSSGNHRLANQQNNDQRNNRNDGSRGDGPRNNEPRSEEGQKPNQRDNRQNNRYTRSEGSGDAASRPPRLDRNNGQAQAASRPAAPNQHNESKPADRERSNRPDRDGSQGPDVRNRQAPERETSQRDAGGGRNTGYSEDKLTENDRGLDDASSRSRNDRDATAPSREERLVIGISLGDYNGIGPEVILKALQYNRLQKLCTPVIYGSMRVLNRYRNLLNLKDWNLNGSPTIGQISHKMTNVITCWPDQNQEIQPGQVTPEAGQAALACLQRAVDDLKDGKLDALVTAPINKYNIQSEEFKFPGHTEYLAQEFGVQDNLMFMVSETLRIGVVTGHVPLGRVRQNVTRERIAQKLTLMMQSLKQDFGIDKPKIAVLGLNPHAGEEGLLGNEEQDIIKPLLTEWRNKGQLVFGPYPADGFFGTRGYTKFDAVLAMYHDQGLIPFKAIAFEEGVNFTAGMPVVRTSPDHGTAYDIAGKNLADETSMLRAIYTAIDVARVRKEFIETEANALK